MELNEPMKQARKHQAGELPAFTQPHLPKNVSPKTLDVSLLRRFGPGCFAH